jgi:hypothetical protein
VRSVSHFTSASCRYVVRVGDKCVALAPTNVILPNRTCAVLDGLSQAMYNGKWAQIKSFDRESGRYTVDIDNDKQLKVKLENLRL